MEKVFEQIDNLFVNGVINGIISIIIAGIVLIAINKLLKSLLKRNGLIIMFYKKELKRLFSLQSF